MANNTRDWEQEHASGKLDFLDRPHEQLRHAVIACMISQHAPGEVIDLGCGRGHQLAWLRTADVPRYTGVDVSASALATLVRSPIPTETVLSSIEDYHAPARAIGAIVCAEALYFLDDPVGPLERIAREAKSVKAIIVSLVVPNERKPNWRKGVDSVWGAFERSGLDVIDRVRVESTHAGIAWDVAIYRAPGRQSPTGINTVIG
jgi:trans-aconitate methyltransferase